MPRNIPITVTATGNISPAIKVLDGWSFRETAGSTATIVIRQGGSAGDIVADIQLSANESSNMSEMDVLLSDGTPHATVTGTISGNVYGRI